MRLSKRISRHSLPAMWRPGGSGGMYVGEQVVTLRANDGTQVAETIPAGSGIGEHRAAFDARFRHMTPFGIHHKSAVHVRAAAGTDERRVQQGVR